MPWDRQDDFSGGLCLDVAPHLMPANCVQTATNMLFDRGKSARARGPISSNEASATTAIATRLAYYKSGGPDAIERLIGVGVEKINGGSYPINPTVYVINESTFAATTLETLAGAADVTYVGKPFQHLDFMLFPVYTGVTTGLTFYGGSATLKTIGSTTVTLTTGDTTALVTTGNTTGMEAGDMVRIIGTARYIGRVTSVTDSTHFKVMPAPAFTEAGMTCSCDEMRAVEAFTSGIDPNAKFGVSFQNRIVLANTIVRAAIGEANPRRVQWSTLPDETPSNFRAAGTTIGGYKQLFGGAFELNSYIEIPDTEPITGLAKMGEGQLIIFGQTGCYRLTGQLQTQTATTGGVQTIDLRRIPYGFGLVEPNGERSIQQSKRGLIFAAPEGIVAYDGSRFYPLMQGTLERDWQNVLATGTDILGSAMLDDNHYLITTTNGSYYVNLNNLAWGYSASPCMSIFDSIRGLSTSLAPRVYACRTFNTNSPPSTTAQIVMVNEAVNYPPAATGEDDDGTDLTFALITRPLTHGDEATPKAYQDARIVGYNHSTTATPAVNVEAYPGLDPDGSTPAAITSLMTESTLNQRTRWTDHIPAAARRNYGMAFAIFKTAAGTNTQYVEIDEVAVRAEVMSPDRMSGI